VETARVLNIPQCFVFSFYTATHALGLVQYVSAGQDGSHQGRAPQQGEHAKTGDAGPDTRRRGLFQRILLHLRGQEKEEIKEA